MTVTSTADLGYALRDHLEGKFVTPTVKHADGRVEENGDDPARIAAVEVEDDPTNPVVVLDNGQTYKLVLLQECGPTVQTPPRNPKPWIFKIERASTSTASYLSIDEGYVSFEGSSGVPLALSNLEPTNDVPLFRRELLAAQTPEEAHQVLTTYLPRINGGSRAGEPVFHVERV